MRGGTAAWKNVLTTAALELEGELDERHGCARGSRNGVRVVYRLATHGSGSSATSVTEVDAEITVPSGFVMLLRPQSLVDPFLVRRGLAVDVTVGDDKFDRAFLVEAAPADVIRAALDVHMRARLLAVHPVKVETCDVGLRLTRNGWEHGRAAIWTMLDIVALLAVAVGAASEKALRGDAAAATGYRGAANVELDLARDAEHVLVKRAQARRHVTGVLVIVALVVLAASFMIVRDCAAASFEPSER
jgi:hypothetical protein